MARHITPLEKTFVLRSIKHILLGFCLISPFLGKAQSNNYNSYSALAEKIYLQPDNTVYTNDQIVWFKAIVTNAADNTPSTRSGVLYVDLIDPNENIIERKLIKLEKGMGEGFFQLNPDNANGTYLLRAYTEWSKNFGDGFFYHQYIQVYGQANSKKKDGIRKIVLIKSPGEATRLTATLDPLAIDSSTSKEVTVAVTLGGKTDTVLVKRTNTGFMLDYVVTGEASYATLRLKTKSGQQFIKTVALSDTCIDLGFYPESGRLVQGITSVVGFKATDCLGHGVPIQGAIVDSKGNRLTTFSANQLGMGSFTLNNADSLDKYVAQVEWPPASGHIKTFPLPAVAALGNVMAVTTAYKNIAVTVSSNYMQHDSLVVRISCRGVIYYDVKGSLADGVLKFSFPAGLLPEGVLAFTLMNQAMKPLAQRLYFNQRTDSRLHIAATLDSSKYVQRQQTNLAIKVTSSHGDTVPAMASVLVVNKAQAGEILRNRANILSATLLTSDLSGHIEQPGFYFSPQLHQNDLDALMLTQEPGNYRYQQDTILFSHSPEPELAVTGTVKGGLFNNKQKTGIGLTMMTFSNAPSVQAVTTDSAGRFRFPINEQYASSLNVLIQSANKAGEKKDYSIVLDKKETPPVYFNHLFSIQKPDSVVNVYVQKSIERKKAEEEYRQQAEGSVLQEVIVKTYQMTPERKKVTDRFGKAKFVLEGQDIRDREEKWSYGLYSVLLFNFPDKVRIFRAGDGNLYARLFNSEPTLVVVDGIPVQEYNYPLIPAIPPSEVSSFEVIEYAKNFSGLYCEVFPQGCAMAPAWGNVIAIYTYAKKGLLGANHTPGIVKAAVPAFDPVRKRSEPVYDPAKGVDWKKPDLRSLVHWQPNIATDSTGKASTSFYNADNIGQMMIIIEAISAEGEIGYHELTYEVEKAKKTKLIEKAHRLKPYGTLKLLSSAEGPYNEGTSISLSRIYTVNCPR